MATIQKLERHSGTKYRVLIRRQGHKTVTKVFARKKEAEDWARLIEGDHNKIDVFPDAEARRRTLADAIDGFMADYKGGDRSAGERLAWWKEHYGTTTLARLTPARIKEGLRQYGASRERPRPGEKTPSGGRAAGTVNRSHASISSVMEWAIEQKWVVANPARGIRRQKESAGRIRFLNENERTALLAACDESEWRQLGLLVRMALSTGARLGELTALRWADIDMKAGVARLGTSKNDEPRTLPLVDAVKKLLAALPRPIDNGLLFRSPHHADRVASFRPAWSAAVQKAGIKDFRFHDLRHSCASYLAMNGATLLEIADVLGHKTLVMVKRYSHLASDHKAKLVTRVLSGMVE